MGTNAGDVVGAALSEVLPGATAMNGAGPRGMVPSRGIHLLPLLALTPAVLLLLPSALHHTYVNRDSGVFLYAGQQLLRGAVPYRDVWDHKGPLIYGLDALGLWLGHGSIWGVLLLQCLALSAAVLAGFDLLRRSFGVLPAVLATEAWTLSLLLLKPFDNLSEEYALPLQFLALLVVQRTQGRRTASASLLLGVTAAAAFLLRPNLIGIWLSLALYDCLRFLAGSLPRRAAMLRNFLWIGLGMAMPLLAAGLYFAAHAAIPDLYDAFIRYNLVYSRAPLHSRIHAAFSGIRLLSQSGISVLAFSGWLLASRACLQRWPKDDGGLPALLAVCSIALPLEIALAALAGRPYPHYVIALLPVMAVLTGSFARQLSRDDSRMPAASRSRAALETGATVIALCLAIAVAPASQLLVAPYQADAAEIAAVHYIDTTVPADGPVLVWGASASTNFLTQRAAPSRYVYQYPLFTDPARAAARFRVFLEEISARPPVIILDASADADPLGFVPPLGASQREQWRRRLEQTLRDAGLSVAVTGVPPEMAQVDAFVAAHYQAEGSLASASTGNGGWVIFRRRDSR